MTILEEVQYLSALIQRLREADKDLRIFGAEAHRYELRPTLTEDQLREFEENHHIKLPEDYRLFLKHVGNGEAGPYYGLSSLEDAARISQLSKPFFWTEEFAARNKQEWPERLFTQFIEVPEMCLLYGQEGRQWSHRPGVLEISEQGCGGFSYLVINGAAYGTVWTEWECHFWPTKLTFGAWYRQWAEDALRELSEPDS